MWYKVTIQGPDGQYAKEIDRPSDRFVAQDAIDQLSVSLNVPPHSLCVVSIEELGAVLPPDEPYTFYDL